MGYEWLLVVPLILGTGLAVARAMTRIYKKMIVHLITVSVAVVYMFVFPGLMRIRFYRHMPYVVVTWDGGTRAVMAKSKFVNFMNWQMKKNGVRFYENNGY